MTPTSAELWQFPCEFPLKVFGKANSEFEAFVLATLHKYVSDLAEGAIEAKPSRAGNYLAMTIRIHATSKEQLDAIYTELNANPLVLMTL
jgi:uncharacterized protein